MGILVAIIHPLIAIPISFFIFYKGYYGVAMNETGYFTFYKLMELIVIITGFIVVFFSLLSYHGPVFILLYLSEKEKNMIVVVLAAIETLIFLTGIVLRIICYLKVQNTFDADDEFD